MDRATTTKPLNNKPLSIGVFAREIFVSGMNPVFYHPGIAGKRLVLFASGRLETCPAYA
jgi:hypothetical protein